MSTYPGHVAPSAQQAADRFYRRLPQIDLPKGYDLDELVDPSDVDGTFAIAALPERDSV